MILLDTQKREFAKLKDIRIFGKINTEDLYNGDLLVIGLGGVGCKVACYLKGMIKDSVLPDDNISFMAFDSDIPAMEATIKESEEGVGFNASEVVSIFRPNLENMLADNMSECPVKEDVQKWMNPAFPELSIGHDGAKGNRQIGRLMFSNAYEDVRMLLFDKIDYMYNKSSESKLDVIIVSGVGGGTGSGILSDLTYNIRAYVRAKKYTDIRIGGCLLMPDVLYGTKAVYDNAELKDTLNANGYATLKEISHYMNMVENNETYTFESYSHKLTIKEDIFDACMLVSGRKDELGHIPSEVIYRDTAYFLYKLATKKYIGLKDRAGNRQLIRDVFLDKNDGNAFKVINETDYRVPVREIENICEYEVFAKAWKRLYVDLFDKTDVVSRLEGALKEIETFVSGKPGEPIVLNVEGLIRMGQFSKPTYKSIKKNTDEVKDSMERQLGTVKTNASEIVKKLKGNLWTNISKFLDYCTKTYGPYAVIKLIGASGLGGNEKDTGLISEIKRLSNVASDYRPSSEYSRIIESIRDIVSRRFFAFPSAKRETEDGYFDALTKDTLAKERTIIMDEIDADDLFGDTIRLLRQRAEQLEDIYGQFGEDLKNAIEELSNTGNMVIGYMLKDISHHEFFPSDYLTDDRIVQFTDSVIKLLNENENKIYHGQDVEVKDDMERIYKTLFTGLGAYAPEKLLTVALAADSLSLQDVNVMFVSPTNDERQKIMGDFAKAFIEGTREKVDKKQLCIIKEESADLRHNKYIFLPESMPYFSKAVKELLIKEPYNEKESSIVIADGEIEISIDDMIIDVPISMLSCVDEMYEAYKSVGDYKGLHINESSIDMREYNELV